MSTSERYFDRLRTVESVTKRYRTLAKRHHPDVGGNSDVMGAINEQYREALRRIAHLQARREAEKGEAGASTPKGGKTQQRANKRGSFSGSSINDDQNAENNANTHKSLQSELDRIISEREKVAADAFQHATEELIRAGARLFGEMAASWITSKTKR